MYALEPTVGAAFFQAGIRGLGFKVNVGASIMGTGLLGLLYSVVIIRNPKGISSASIVDRKGVRQHQKILCQDFTEIGIRSPNNVGVLGFR